uniref:MAP3K HisK-N-like globin domain-containing protein n=1 Tax=Ditylenchus dipsaci TaxID=166011 RepID=A0A915EMA4_9BILA
MQCASASPNLCYTSNTTSTLMHPCSTFDCLSFQSAGVGRCNHQHHHHAHSIQQQPQQHQSGSNLNSPAVGGTQQSSQPTSPAREHCPSIHTPLTASPSLCESSPFLSIPPNTSLSIPEENSMANRFFTLQKEGERRITLASLMQEHQSEIIEKWWEQFMAETRDEELLITKDTMRQLLTGLRAFLVPPRLPNKENACDSLQATIRQISREISPNNEPMPISQLMLALYIFPNAVQPSLKLQGIKPHWMFTLDDLIRNAVQQALKLMQPAENAICVHEIQQCGAGVANQNYALVSPRTCSTTQDSEHIRKLYEEMINVEKETKDLLEVSLLEKQLQLKQLASNKAFTGLTTPCHTCKA